jgi:hypothetical protein
MQAERRFIAISFRVDPPTEKIARTISIGPDRIAPKRSLRPGSHVKPGTLILRSPGDDVVPFGDSVELLSKSGLLESALIEVGRDHRLADPEPLEALLRAVGDRGEHERG